MKTRSKILTKAILCVLVVALTLVIYIPVAATTNSTTLTTTVPKTLPLSLELAGNGTVTVNNVAYTQSGKIEIPRHTTIELSISPNTGNEIQSVIYKGCDYTADIKDGSVTLPAITEGAMLSIEFSEIPIEPKSYASFYWLLLILPIGIAVALYLKKKHIR